MGTTTEAAPVGMFGPNAEGVRVLSQDATITFSQYIRYVLPLDGYVFWLKTIETQIAGSLHVIATKEQREDETIAINRMVFTTKSPVQQFNAIAPNEIWIGQVGANKFAFSHSGPRFVQSGLFHYVGDAVYPAMESQLTDVGAQLPTDTLIVSNSLPAWLTLYGYRPIWLVVPNPEVLLYPSFAVPDNLRPPYGVVHIEPQDTEPLGPIPVIGACGAHSQLAKDRVRVTLYGLTNAQALAWDDLVIQYITDTETIGLVGPTIVRDEKRTQPELGVLAMKKTISYQVSYLQETMPHVAIHAIEKVVNQYFPQN